MKYWNITLCCLSLLAMVSVATAAEAPAAADDGMGAAKEALLGTPKKVELPLKETEITANQMEYNYKEAVAILTDDVVVDDARFRLTSDKLFVFLDGTNNLSRLVVLGNVAVSNENRRAYCKKAVYTKATEQLVLVGDATLINIDEAGKESKVRGDKITIWTVDQRIEVYPNPKLTLPANANNGLKDLMP